MLQQPHLGSLLLRVAIICRAQASFAPVAWAAQVLTSISSMQLMQTKISLPVLAKTFRHLLQRYGVSRHSSARVTLSVPNISFKADGFAAA